MFKITKIESHCEAFFPKPKSKKIIYGLEFFVEDTIKYVAVTPSGVLYGFETQPSYKGHWKSGKENPIPIAKVEFEGDFLESVVKL